MPEDLQQPIAQDYTEDTAALVMPDIEAEERAAGREFPRDDSGRFKAQDAQQADEAARIEADRREAPKDLQDKASADKSKDAKQAEPEDEDYIELPPEAEGKEAVRIKLADAIDAHRARASFEKEIADLKEQAGRTWLPNDVESAIGKALEHQHQHIDAIKAWQSLAKPSAPDESLLDPNNPNHDPARFWILQQAHKASLAAHDAAEAQIKKLKADADEKAKALHASRLNREMHTLLKVKPELATKGAPEKVVADVVKLYGFDEATVHSVVDHRFYVMAMDALAWRAAQEKQAAAAKVVAAKPKIVRGNARQPSGPSRNAALGMSRLMESGSVEDGAAALEGLL